MLYNFFDSFLMKRQNKKGQSLPEWNILKAHGLVLFISDELKQWNSIISSMTKEQYKQGQRLLQWNTFNGLGLVRLSR